MSFVCNGRSSIHGEVKAQTVEVNGSTSFEAKVDTGSMQINGKADVEGSLSARELRVDGQLKVKAGLSGEDIVVNGYLKVQGACEAESFRSRGCFRVDGLLNAGSIEVDLYTECRAKEIGGETISVRKTELAGALGKLVRALMFAEDALIFDTIEGDEVYLEHTRAGIVRAKNVSLGPGCDIGLVEYADTFNHHPDSRVGESRKSL